MNRSATPKTRTGVSETAAGETTNGRAPIGNPVSGQADWLTGSGIIDRMLAYRDWWNLPAGRAPGGNRETR